MSVLSLKIVNLLVVQGCTDLQMFKKGRGAKGGYRSPKDLARDALDVRIRLGGKEPSAHEAWSHEGAYKMK